MSGLDRLLVALAELDAEPEEARATSVRLPEALHRAVLIATELGMDASFTAATKLALLDRLHAFARQRALAEHFAAFPADTPTLAGVAHRRIRGTDHPGVRRPELIDETAAWVASRRPEWASNGVVDATVDDVLGYVEMLAAGVGTERSA